MKTIFQITAFVCALITSVAVNAQNVVSTESFPNTFNTSGTAGTGGSFNGSIGSWTATVNANSIIRVNNNYDETSAPYAIQFATNTTSGATSATATAPVVNLAFGACTPSSISLSFQLRPQDVDAGNNNYNIALQFYNGSTWSTVWDSTANEMNANMGTNDFEQTTVNIANSYWVAGFRYRFVSTKTSGTANTSIWIDDIVINAITTGPAFPDFSDANPTKTTDGGAPGGGFEVGDVYRFNNVVTSPEVIYAEIKIEAIVNAVITNLDNNAAGISQRFQPRIRPDVLPLVADREGYVQFSITFKKASDNNVAFLDGLRYRHFDIDGSAKTTGTDAYTFRETGWVTGQDAILVNTPNNLTDGGTVVSGPPAATSWRKILGQTAEHNGITSDPDVYFTATYSAISVLRFRLGYAFDETSTNASFNPGSEGREYATEFGCFDLTRQIILPVKLLSFAGSYRNNTTTLNWETVNEENFDRFEIERSNDGASFAAIGSKQSLAGGYSDKKQYNYFDDLSSFNGTTVYYRLKMIDLDGKFKYSNVILVRREQKTMTGIVISPNPVVSGIATVRFTATSATTAEFRVVDMAGRTVLQQSSKVYEGTNSVSISNLDRLQPGIYMLQMSNGEERTATKFSITR